jgi:hypothetical protein
MEAEALRAVISAAAPYAGLGGIAVGAVIWLFRGVISQNIFPQLTKDQAYRLIRLLVILAFALGVLGIGGWIYTQPPAVRASTAPLSVPPLPTVKAIYTEDDQNSDISIIEQIVQDHASVVEGGPAGPSSGPFSGSAISSLTVIKVEEGVLTISETTLVGTQTISLASLADLSGTTTVLESAAQGVFLRLQCRSGQCVKTRYTAPNGMTPPPPRAGDLIVFPINLDRSSTDLLALRRALARLLSRTHSDVSVCDQVAADSSAAHCPSDHIAH